MFSVIIMKKQFLEAGKIVGTHGVRGEMRIDPWCDSPAFLSQFKTLYLNKGEKPIEVSCRPHKNIVLAKAKGVDSIESAELLRGQIVYINRDDVRLPEGKNFIQDLIGCRVLDADDSSIEYGVISDVFKTGANDVYTVKNSEGREFLVPVIDSVIVARNVDEGYVLLRPIEGLFDDEA